ncbi:unnamed protein product [Polarella glacialis]|uniref:Titin n=1 Tax=Polarella glacialis TaxID=89957 RepID=A0A813JQ28_POLGL|nr:unnamed protein product [Polarella glacialis]
MDGLYKVQYLVNIAGSYNIAITLNGKPINGSPFTFIARPGSVDALHSTTEGSATSSFMAGTEASFIVQARDAYSNPLDEAIGNVTASIQWERYLTTTTMPVLDDVALNNAQFGRYFYGESAYEGNGRYKVRYTALREGLHKLYVKVNAANVHGSPFYLTGEPAAAPYGPKSLAASSKPPNTATAGVEVAFQVQLRDAYGNILASSPPGVISISVGAPPPVTQLDVGVCTAVIAGSTGLYDCRVTPTISGHRLLSVQVDGVEISKIETSQPLSTLNVTQGPFPIYVEPSAVSAATTVVYNVNASYIAGQTMDATVQLRDQFGNNRTSSVSNLFFQGRFGPATLDYVDHNDGSITVAVGTFLAGRHPLQITISGVQISNTPTPEIPVYNSIVKYDGTDCATPIEVTAGVQQVFQCFPRDTYGNHVADNDLFIEAEFVNMDDPDAPVVAVKGTYSTADTNYDLPLEIKKVGAYSVVTQLWARGGLIGRYYRTPGFQSLVSLLTDRPHQGQPLFEYTRVDPVLDIIWPGRPVDSCPEDYFSIRWTGYLLPRTTGLHTIRIEADRGARVKVGEAWIIDELDSDIAVRASAQVSLVNHVPIYIEVEYKHSAGTSFLRLYWASTDFEDEKVPTVCLLHALNVLPMDTTVVVIPQEAAEQSVASGDALVETEAGEVNSFILHTRDENNNQRATQTISALSGYIASEPPAMMTFQYLGGGNYTSIINPIVSGNYPMHVMVNGVDIVGSPFNTNVVPGPTSAVHTKIEGTGLTMAQAGVEAVFMITLRDVNINNRGMSLGQSVVVDNSRFACEDIGLGNFRCAYTITQSQTINVILRVNGQNVNPVAPHTYQITIHPKPIDSSSGFTYMFGFTEFFAKVRRGTPNQVIFQVKDDFGNDVTDSSKVYMMCEAEGPERKSAPYTIPLDIHTYATGLFKLNLQFDKTGDYKVYCYVVNQGGLNSRYFNNRWVEGLPAITRVDTTVDFNWGEGLVTADSSDYASAQFDAYLQAPKAANYTFYITADDGAKLWLDDELVLSQDEAGQYSTTPRLLKATRLYHIQVMYYERTGFARLRLEWSSDGGLIRQVINADNLFHTRSLLGQFPLGTKVYDKPGQVEAFYHRDFQYDNNNLQWVAPQDNGNKPILGYRIYRDDGQGGPISTAVATTDQNTNTFSDKGIITGNVYYYRIMATNGDDGEPLTISAQPSVPPVKPDPALLIGTNVGGMKFRFTPLTGSASGWSPTIRYTLYRNDGLGGVLRFTYEGDMDGSSAMELAIGGLVEGRSYLFQTSYWSRIGQSPLSNVASVLCCEFMKPGSPPANLRRDGEQSNEKITVSWDPVQDIGSSSLIYYRVYMDDGTSEISKNTVSGTTTSVFFEFLTPGNAYRFAVSAVNAAGEGPRSVRLTLTASDIAGQPYNVMATYQSYDQIDLVWSKPLMTGASGMSGYKVYADDGNGGPITNLIWDGGLKASTLFFSWAPRFSDGTVALLAGHSYRFQVQSVNPTGDGVKSDIFTAVAASVPAAPGRPQVDKVSTSGKMIVITWAAPEDGGSPLLGYVLERKSSASSDWIQRTTMNDKYTPTSFQDNFQVVPGSTYIYRVYAYNLVEVGVIQYSPEANIPAAAVPSAPELAFVTSTETTITVSWNIPISDLTVSGFKLYVDSTLKYDGTGIATVRTFTLAGCATGNMHDFRVTAVSAAGESVQSASLPKFCARRPYPPAQPKLEASSLKTITINWLLPANTGGMPISGYKVQRSNHDLYYFGTVQCLQDDGSYLTTLPENYNTCKDDTANICPDRMCKYRVLAINGIEDNNFADISPYLTATAANLPQPPQLVTRELPPVSKTVIEVQWSAVTSEADAGGALVTGYRIYSNTGNDDPLFLVFDGSGSPSVRSFRHTGLVPGRRYRYQVSSMSTAGEGSRTSIFSFAASEPPSATSQPRFVDSDGLTMTIGMDPPPSDGGAAIVRYVVYRNDGTPSGLLSTSIHICDTQMSEFQIPDLQGGRDYQIQLEAHSGCPTGEESAEVVPLVDGQCPNKLACTLAGARSAIALYTTTKLPDPTKIARVVESQTRTSITFSWNAPDNDGGSYITSFEPYRDDGLGGDFVRVDVLPTSYFESETDTQAVGSEYKFTGLVTGRRYNFFIAACNKRGCKSGVVAGPFTAASKPDQPTGLIASATSNNPPYIYLSWTPPDNGGLPLTSTEIERDDGQEGLFEQTALVIAPNITFADISVVAGRTYRYRIRARNSQSASDYSRVMGFTAAGVPGKPVQVQLVSQSRTNLTVMWTAPVDNGADIYQFVLRRDDGLGSAPTQIYRGASVTFQSTGLAMGRYYSFTMAARNAAGEGPASDAARFLSVSMPSPVGQPILLTSSCAGGSVSFKWTRPENDGGCGLRRYKVMLNGALAAGDSELPSTSLFYSVAGLNCAEKYTWSILTKNCLDVWGSSSPTLETYTASLPVKVQGLNATSVSSTELLFAWQPLVGTVEIGSTDQTILRGYELFMDDGLGGRFTRAYDGYNKPYEIYHVATGLVPGRTYRGYVRALNIVGTGDDSEVIYRSMSVEPSAPSELSVESGGETTVSCTWKPPQESGGEPVENYVLEYAPEPLFNTWQQDGPFPDNTQFAKQVYGLVKGTLYQFRIRAVTNAGSGLYSNIVSFIVGTPPTAGPTGLTRAATTSVSMTWGWSPLPDLQAGGAPLSGYRLYMNTGRDDETSLIYDGGDSPSVTEFTASSLVCGRTYVAEVSAVTRIGEGPKSSKVPFALAHSPSQPRAARVLSSSTAGITLAWDIPESTGCAELLRYQVERDSGGGFKVVANVSTPMQTYTDYSSLLPGYMYIYRVTARNVALDVDGPHSDHITAYAASLPGLVGNLGYVGSTRTSITLQWDSPSDTGGAQLDAYRVQADDGFGGDFTDVAVVTGNYATIGYLYPGRPYRFRIAAETVVGSGPYSPIYQQVVAALPGTPTTPVVTSVPGYLDRIRVSWAEPADNGGSLTLGYKVVFDGNCDRYDGTSIASVTSVQIHCDIGKSNSISVRGRNIVGWGGSSPSVIRYCGAEPIAPTALRLEMAVPPTPLEMVDLRTPTAMTLMWDAPTVDGGNSVKSYQLYRDAGDASGIYTLAYAGTSNKVTLHSLTNSKIYRFYAVAVNDVGAGPRSTVFTAEMRCTPRQLVAAPYKVDGSPWSVKIAWPETADNCGRAVSGYRVYRNSQLIYPVSNTWVSEPKLVGALGTNQLTVRLTAKDTGLVWVAVITDDDLATTAPPTMSAPQVKLGNGAMGRLTCRSSGSPVSAGVATTIVLHGCELLGGGNYALFAYVESTLGLDSDGSLFGPLQFQVPQPSNSFSVKAAINNNTLNKDGLDVSFATSAPAGMGYVMVAYEASYLQLTVKDVKAFANAVGDGPCKWHAFVYHIGNSVRLSGCRFIGGATYRLLVYVEDGRARDDGSLSEPLLLTVPPSNSFVGRLLACWVALRSRLRWVPRLVRLERLERLERLVCASVVCCLAAGLEAFLLSSVEL